MGVEVGVPSGLQAVRVVTSKIAILVTKLYSLDKRRTMDFPPVIVSFLAQTDAVRFGRISTEGSEPKPQ